ncbi:THUMP-like domain-containing protein [Corynebacterium guangdongense]|uniref:THUMP-like domain-containing protein n=1 Tax=Corynebacterium guangdongense TaxID=1783348 RepID=A0ABU1ZZ25_9CORY|nr:SAM-dependent methyltransferase [Corynebacterium guangdongense]MDR7329133.1 hypothetical protein [Corynebacterium guangdongense]WJZ17702.1 hypothetical protein CGUA_05590 [Corynebacterium guangdongense]
MALDVDEVTYFSVHDIDVDFGLTRKSMLDDARRARAAYGDYGRAALEIATARASGKFPVHWLADTDSAQQATPHAVAVERARRLADAGVDLVHDVTCSIGTEGEAFRFTDIGYLGSDLDPARLLMARHNLGPGAWLARADALASISRRGVILADPARRAGGRRITDPAKLIPPLPDLLDAYPGREMAVKCAPGLDFSGWEGLVSVTSVDGAVKEACLYTPGLGTGREAVVIGAGVDRITSAMPDDVGAGEPGTFLIDPDGAIVRAGLVRHWAYREHLWMLDEHIAYLTGDRIPAGCSGFEILEQVPLKKLRAALTPYDAGSLEILVRGVDVDPDALRKKLKLKGTRPMAVVCTRIGRAGVALICGPRQWA